MHVVIGTAGHIDHGKSALVKALTGTDPDRLKEEKERGMTTDLGFAFFGDNVTIIDVPGHEKFVRHMLAGASTVDVVMLVVAADDSVMPQTKEHFEICRLVGIRQGLVVINKADLVDDEWLELVKADIAGLVAGSFLEGAPVHVVSALTGRGIPELASELKRLAAGVTPRTDRGVFRLPVDRSFSIKGFGTVVAGTVLSGRCRVGDRLDLLPREREVRVRGVQIHEKQVELARLGDRAALNLQGVEKELVKRGDVLATPGYYKPSDCFNATLYLLKSAARPLRNMARLSVHISTAEVLARVVLLDAKELAPGQEGMVQFRLEEPVVCDWNDRYVVRSFSPQETLGGGTVLEPAVEKERRFVEATLARLRALSRGDSEAVLEQHLLKSRFEPRTLPELARLMALAEADLVPLVERLVEQGKVERFTQEGREHLVHGQNLTQAGQALVRALEEFHRQNPARLGMKRAELREKAAPFFAVPLFDEVLARLTRAGELATEQDRIRLAAHQVRLKPEEQKVYDRVAAEFRAGGFAPPDLAEALAGTDRRLAEKARTALLETGVLVDVGESVVLHREAVEEARQRLLRMFARKPELTASEIRQELGTTRKYLIPLLNYFDSRGVTQRKGEVRTLRK